MEKTYFVARAFHVAHADVNGTVVQILLARTPTLGPVLGCHIEGAFDVAVDVALLLVVVMQDWG